MNFVSIFLGSEDLGTSVLVRKLLRDDNFFLFVSLKLAEMTSLEVYGSDSENLQGKNIPFKNTGVVIMHRPS